MVDQVLRLAPESESTMQSNKIVYSTSTEAANLRRTGCVGMLRVAAAIKAASEEEDSE